MSNLEAAERYITKLKMLGNDVDNISHFDITIKNRKVILNKYVIGSRDFNKDSLQCEIPEFADLVAFNFSVEFSCKTFNKISITSKKQEIINLSILITMFQYCTYELDLQSVNFEGYESLRKLFFEASDLRKVTLGYGGTTIRDVSQMFCRCSQLEEIDFNKMTLNNVADVAILFKQCKSLKCVDLSCFKGQRIIDATQMFFACQIESVDLTPINWQRLQGAEQMFEQSKIRTIDLRCVHQNSHVNAKKMFLSCNELEDVQLGQIQSNGINCYQMFADCKKLKYIHYNGFSFKGCEYAQLMFSDCKSLDFSTFKLQELEPEDLNDITMMFDGCSIRDIDLSNCKLNNILDSYRILYKCTGIRKINLRNTEARRVTQLYKLLSDCEVREIDLSYCVFSNQFPEDIMMLLYLDGLEILDLTGTKVTSKNIEIPSKIIKNCIKGYKAKVKETKGLTIFTSDGVFKV